MRRKRFLGFLPAFCLMVLPMVVQGQDALKLGEITQEFGADANVPLTLTNADEVQGLVAVIDWDAASGAVGQDLVPASALAEADTVVTRVGDNFMVLGVVMDSDPSDNGGEQEVIPPGDDTLIATAVITSPTSDGEDPIEIGLAFTDGTYAAAEDGPALDNVIVVGGLSIGFDEGLTLTEGKLTAIPTPDKLIIESIPSDSPAIGAADVRVLLNNREDVEGFVLVICHDPADLTFNAADVGAAAAAADFIAVESNETGAALGVVIDLEDPMPNPPNIPAGQGNHIATFSYVPAGDEPLVTTTISFCDGDVGSPPKENLIVVGGQSFASADGLVLESEPENVSIRLVCDPRETICDDGIDNDCDGLIDLDDPDCLQFDFEILADVDGELLPPECIEGPVGGVASGMLYINSPRIGEGGAPVAVQGFSLGFSYNCDEINAVEEFDVAGTILESVGAEFVGIHADNAADAGGDGCSMVLGVLLDAVPPFDGQVIPGLLEPQALGVLSFMVVDGVACDSQLMVMPADGVTGAGNVPVRNVVSVDNQAVPATVRPIGICSTREERFFRGDCNWSRRSNGNLDPVEIADAAAVISFLFQKSIFKFEPPCLDACDGNDDGRIDLADAIFILYYLFVPGSPFPPDPGPGLAGEAGVDPTPDPLDCAAGTACEI